MYQYLRGCLNMYSNKLRFAFVFFKRVKLVEQEKHRQLDDNKWKIIK